MIDKKQIRQAVETLQKNSVPPHICIKCGEEFYVHDGKGFVEGQADYAECECGGELILKRRP